MKKILFVMAMEKEAMQIATKLELQEIKQDTYKLFRKENISLIIVGIGKQRTAINLTKYLENNEKPDVIINIGYAGSTDEKIGTWVNVNNSFNYEWQILDEEKYSILCLDKKILKSFDNIENLPCYSAEAFVTSSNIKEKVLFDMELHSIYAICQMYNIELISLKKVSDNLCLDEYYKNIERQNLELESSLEILNNIIKLPYAE